MIRKACLDDVKTIHRIVSEQAKSGRLLARAMSELYTQVRDFQVYEDDETHEIVGCGALQVVWKDSAEIRSLAVLTEKQGSGIGTQLIRSFLQEAKDMGVGQVFVLTYRDTLFERLGFKKMDKKLLPHKIWADCIRCAKFPECDEIALTAAI